MKSLIVNVFWDIFYLYKNIIHFFISKILILLVTLLYIIVFFIPIFLVFGLIFNFLGFFDWGFNPYLFLGNPYYMIGGILFIVFLFIAYIISYSWSQILLNRLSFWYVNREKLPFSKNYYFDKKLFFIYFKVSLLLILIALIPFIIWWIGFLIIISFFWGISESLAVANSWIWNSLSISLLILTILSLILLIYLMYKTIFTYVILVDKYLKWKEIKKAIYYVKKSFKFTKWVKRFFRFFVVSLIIWILISPIYFFEDYFSTKAANIKDYIYYSAKIKNWEDLKEYTIDYETLKLDYSDYDVEQLNFMVKKYSYLATLFYILEFVLIWGLYNLVLVSFYKNEKKLNNN